MALLAGGAALLSPLQAAGAALGGVGAALASASLASLAPGDVHILVVDDERLTRLVVANLLRKCSYQGAPAARRGAAPRPALLCRTP
jgi:hypothetical protein